jgi:hypothetical protein
MVKKSIVIVFLILVSHSLTHAELWSVNAKLQNFNQEYYDKYPNSLPQSIVAGHIVTQNIVQDHSTWLIDGLINFLTSYLYFTHTQPIERSKPNIRNITFKVTSVLFGDRKYEGQVMTIPVERFEWPETLVNLRSGSKCILFLTWEWVEGRSDVVQNYVRHVSPAHDELFPVAKNIDEIRVIMEYQIIKELDSETNFERQRMLLIQLAPILSEKNAKKVEPFLLNQNIWVVRAALAALIYSTENKKYIKKAAPDIQNFLASLKSSDMIKVNAFSQQDSRSYFFEHYFFLEKCTWTWGCNRDEGDKFLGKAAKHLRILKAIIKTGLISHKVKKYLDPDPDHGLAEYRRQWHNYWSEYGGGEGEVGYSD